MSVISLFLISLLLHAFVGWTLAPDLAAVHSMLGAALWVLLLLSAMLLPMGFLGRRITKPVLSHFLTWIGLISMGLGSSLFVSVPHPVVAFRSPIRSMGEPNSPKRALTS